MKRYKKENLSKVVEKHGNEISFVTVVIKAKLKYVVFYNDTETGARIGFYPINKRNTLLLEEIDGFNNNEKRCVISR